MDRDELFHRINMCAGAFILAVFTVVFVSGCAGLGQPLTQDQLDKAQAGAAYLDASVTRLQEALAQVKADPEATPAKVQAAEDALAAVKMGSSALKASTTTVQAHDKWAWAKAALDTALTVVAPVIIGALVK